MNSHLWIRITLYLDWIISNKKFSQNVVAEPGRQEYQWSLYSSLARNRNNRSKKVNALPDTIFLCKFKLYFYWSMWFVFFVYQEYKQQWILGILLSQPSSHNSVTRTGHWWSSTQLSLSRISSAVVDILSLCPVMSTRKNLVGTLHTGKFLNGFCPHGISYSFKATLIPMLDVCLAVQIVDGRQMHS